MSLRTQVALLLIALCASFVALTYGVESWVVLPAFVDIERREALRDADRCINGVGHDIAGLQDAVTDWAAWDESYEWIRDRNRKFAEANLIPETFANLRLSLLAILDHQGKLAWGEFRDASSQTRLTVSDAWRVVQTEFAPLAAQSDVDAARSGLLRTSRGTLLVAARPIITSKRQGPIRGVLVFGRFLDGAEIAALAQRTHLDVRAWSVGQASLPAEARVALTRCRRGGRKWVESPNARTLHSFALMHDLGGQPALLLRVAVPRDVTAQGRVSAFTATCCSVAGGLLTALIVGMVLRRRVVGPVAWMAAHAARVGRDDDLKARLNLQRSDELGTLARAFDEMVASLDESRKRVLESAHRAGMAEIASEVLHNVGNAVNSASCSAEVLAERLANSKLAGLERAAALLRAEAHRAAEFFGRDPRGPKWIDYLLGLNDTLRRELADNQAEVLRLQQTVRHIREAVATQQDHAGRSDFRQEVAPRALVDETLHLVRDKLRQGEVQVELDVPPLPEATLNKCKVTQVLVNLVTNAIQAMADQPSDARRLTLTVRAVEEDGLEIAVSDTGHGFDAEIQTRLFNHGFTTKPEGNGLGLHYCANALADLGGHITAQSAGPGQGATFRIRLPHALPAALSAV